ncbi:SRPBCC family protein [Lentzea sp. NEAU-D7]|uniref:SRPBCC family protein n=1 Tax=Lentzea sp. NEAU-D7 TaxID=2994667 RepID=UPI00224AA241|nr:SRPBCC family protein [Lentzea sp. NEAU-D7]
MTALPRSRSIPADADTVFQIAADLANTAWLPPGVETELSGPRLLRLWFRDRDVEMPIMIDWKRLCVQWGSDSGADYSGRLRVLRLGDNTSVVSVDLHVPRGVRRTRVDAWIDEALTALASEVRAELAPDSTEVT